MVMGSGPPLVLLPGLSPENGRPSGLARNGELQTMAPFAKRFTTYWIGRPSGLRRGTSFGEITAAVAEAISSEFDQPVNVLGISTGGSHRPAASRRAPRTRQPIGAGEHWLSPR